MEELLFTHTQSIALVTLGPREVDPEVEKPLPPPSVGRVLIPPGGGSATILRQTRTACTAGNATHPDRSLHNTTFTLTVNNKDTAAVTLPYR